MTTQPASTSGRHAYCRTCPFRTVTCQNACRLAGRETNSVSAKTALYYEGDPHRGLIFLQSGSVKLTKYLADGRRFIIGFFHAGDLIGMTTHDGYSSTAETLTDVSYRILPRDFITSEMQTEPGTAVNFLELLGRETEASEAHMMLLARKTPMEKVASFLLSQARLFRRSDGEAIELPMSRSEIADHLGLTIETVCRVLTKMKTMGLIAISHIKFIDLLDIEALTDLSDGEEDKLIAA